MKPVKPSIYIDFNKENNKESPKFKVGPHVSVTKYKNIFAKKLCSNLVRRSVCDYKSSEHCVIDISY